MTDNTLPHLLPQDASTLDLPSTSQQHYGARFRSLTRYWLHLGIGLGFVGLGVWIFRPSPQRVDLAPVTQGSLQVTVDAEGQTRVRDRFVIAASVTGRLTRVNLDVGDDVTQGDSLAQIDPLPLTSQVKQAQAQLQALQSEIKGVETQRPKPAALAQADMQIQVAQADQQAAAAELAKTEVTWQQAQRDWQRAQDLSTQGVISAQDLETARLTLISHEQDHEAAKQQWEAANSAVQVAQQALEVLQAEVADPDYLIEIYQSQIAEIEAELTRLQDDTSRTTMVAPASGQVLRIWQESERVISAGTPLLEIGDPNHLEIVIDVLSSDAVTIEPGDTIEVVQWGGDQTLMARVEYLEPAAFTKVSALGVDEQRVNVVGYFEDPQVPLGDGFRVDTHIVIERVEDQLKVPISAIFPCDQGSCVFTVDNGRAQLTPVMTGLRNRFEVSIEEGLQVNEIVILYPESIETGQSVQPR